MRPTRRPSSRPAGVPLANAPRDRLLHTLDYSLQSDPQDARRGRPGPGIVQFPVHQPAGQGVSATGGRGVGRYQEEGIGRPVPRGRSRVQHPRGHSEEVEVYELRQRTWVRSSPTASMTRRPMPARVSVGIDHRHGPRSPWRFLRRWWRKWVARSIRAPSGSRVTADGGGSNGRRCRLWKVELEHRPMNRPEDLGAPCPAGHQQVEQDRARNSCHITENWRGRPLVSRQVVVSLIGHTDGESRADDPLGVGRGCPTGRKMSNDQDEGTFPQTEHPFHRRVELQLLSQGVVKRTVYFGGTP